MTLLQTLIENYDLSDMVNQSVIIVLCLLLVAQTRIKVRLGTGKNRWNY